MDKIEKLYLSLIESGLLSEETPFEVFQSEYTSNQDYNKKVYDAAVDNDLTSEDYETFSSFYSPELPVPDVNVSDEIEDVVEPAIPTAPPTGEKDTAIERQFGKNFITDFFGDIYRAGAQGFAQGATVDDALKVFAKGEDISDEDLQDYIASINEMESYGPSDEIKDFQRIYEQGGKGVIGFVKGIANNPTVIPQLFTSSISAMINPSVAAGAGAGALTGAGAGALAGAAGGPLAGITASGGAIAGAIGGMSGVLEAGLAYTEFLKDEIESKGLEFNDESIRQVLEDEDALRRIRNKSLARGISIAAIDALSGGLASKATTSVARGVASKAAGALAGGTVEAIGGSVGETVARGITGQEMDIAEIGFEGVAGTATAPITVTRGLIKAPKYKVKGQNVSRRTIQDIVKTSTPEQLAKIEFTVVNDPDLKEFIQEKKADALIEMNVRRASPGLNEDEISKVVALEKEKKKLTGNETTLAKKRLSEINDEIESISQKKETTVETTNEELPITEEPTTEGQNKTALAISSDAKSAISEGKKKTIGSINESGDTIFEEVDFTKEDADLELERLLILAERGRLTEEEWQQSFFGQNTDSSTFQSSKDAIEQDPVGFIQSLIKSFTEEPTTEGQVQEDQVEYTLPEDPEEAKDDFEIIDNRGGKADLDIDGKEGNWYVRNKVTDKIVATTSKKRAQELIDSPDWDYGEGDVIVKETKKDFVTLPSIERPFIVPSPKTGRPTNTQINFTEDGKIESIVNKNTGKEVSPETRKKAEKIYLQNIIDVDAGETFEFQEGMTPDDVQSGIASDSKNLREVAEAIKREEQIVGEKIDKAKEAKTSTEGLFGLLGEFFTPDSWKRASGISVNEMEKGNPGFTATWIRTKNKKGESLEDGFKGYDKNKIVDFIQTYPSTEVINQQLGIESVQNTLIELKNKFTELTGLEATKTNVDTVVGIEEGRTPLAEIKQKEKEKLRAEDEERGGAFGKKKGPSPKKIIEGKPTMVTVDEAKALTDQIRLEARAAREAKLDQTKKRKALSNAISLLAKRGTISTKKASAIISKLANVNLDNSITLERTLSYIEKVFEDADNKSRIDQAEALRKSIRKKYKKVEATVSDAVKEFLTIDPWLVENINDYIDVASQVNQGVTPTTRAGIKPAVDLKSMQDYSFDAINRQNDIKLQAEQNAFEELTGLSARDLSLAEMRSIINGVEDEASNAKVEDKEKIISDGIKKAFDTYSGIISGQLKTGIDPFTGETISFDSSQKKLANQFIDMNLDLLDTRQKMEALDALINFATNSTTGKMGAIISEYNGILEANKINKKGIQSKKLNIFGTAKGAAQAWIKNISSLPNAFEILFASPSKSREVMKAMGVQGIVDGASRGAKRAERVFYLYVNRFKDKNPNGKKFFDISNATERGMYGFVKRTVQGTPEEKLNEFERRKTLARETYEDLLASQDDVYVEIGEVYKEIYDKILKDSNTIEEVESKVDNDNLEAVNYVINIWENVKSELDEVSLNYYNKVLGSDENYLPDVYSLLENTKETPDILQPIFNPDGSKSRLYDKKTGVLIEATRPNTLRSDKKPRYVNFSFDSQNLKNLEAALIDSETAGPIRQVKGFQSTDAYKKIFPDEKEREIVEERIKKYVDIKRGVSGYTRSEENFLNAINKLATFGVARTLAGVTQPIKQFVPFVNTSVNAGIGNTYKGAQTAMTSVEANEALDKLGLGISKRGVESQADLNSINTKLNKIETSNTGKLTKTLDDFSKEAIKYALVKPDVFTARSSFFAYYFDKISKKGIDVENIDWANHQWDMDAATYAQSQVDRQQNVSDTDLQGDLFTSQNPYVQLSRKVFFPFANFLLNQKSRMYSDITTLRSDTATEQDKVAARKSLAGLAAETVAFNGISYAISQALVAASFAMMGKEESEEDEKIRKGYQITGKLGNIVSDVLIPIPVMNDPGMQIINGILDLVQDSDDPFQFFANDEKTLFEQLGVLGIGFEKATKLKDLIIMASTGESRTTYMGKERVKKLSKESQDAMKVNAVAYMLFLAGALPSEVGYITDRNIKIATKKSDNKKISKEDLKKINKDLYNKIYGPGSSYYKNKQLKKKLKP